MSVIATVFEPQRPLPKTAWQLFASLLSGDLVPGPAWEKGSHRRKFLLRSLAMPFATAHFLSRLVDQPHLARKLHMQPGLPCRLHRPWLSVNLTRQQASEAICWHYDTFHRLLPEGMVNSYLTTSGCTLARLTGKDEQSYSIRLWSDAALDKEGEATLTFYDALETPLARLTFTVCPFNGLTTLYIGGLQGPKSHVPHEAIQGATKACHGLFPKRLLVEAAMMLAQFLEVEAIRAVSNETHIYQSLRYRKKKLRQLHADYNSFWESLGGVVDGQRDFVLPLMMPRKPIEEIASKKRAEYRRRYELLDSLQSQTAERCQR